MTQDNICDINVLITFGGMIKGEYEIDHEVLLGSVSVGS
jgi:hypothetical protein